MTIAAQPGPRAPRSALSQELLRSEEDVLDSLELVRRALRLAVAGATARDPDRLAEAKGAGRELASRHFDMYQTLLGMLARRAPVAGDLRLTIALLHANDSIERMARQCSSIAVMSSAMPPGVGAAARQLSCLKEMRALADRQLIRSSRTFSRRDTEAVPALREEDSALNERNRRCFLLALHAGPDCARREAALFVALMARAIERIGDNAVDIGNQASFISTGSLGDGRNGDIS